MKKLIMAVGAALGLAIGALAANVSSVERFGVDEVDESYVATPVYSAAAHNLSEAGWYAGLTLTWDSNVQKTADTNVSVTDNSSLTSDISYTASSYNTSSGNNKAPDNSGMINTMTSSGWLNRTYYMATTTWYFRVTPEMMYECFKAGKDYQITLAIGDNTYTVTVPKDVELKNGDVKWYPTVGLLDEKVYGEAQLLADAITLENYTDVKFLADPSGLMFPDGFAAGEEEDGEWGVRMLYNHDWSFAVEDGTNLVATCGAANCPYNNGVASMWLDVGTTEKDYDGQPVTIKAEFDEYFEDVFPNVSRTLTVNEVVDGTINTAGVYTVALAVTGLGDGETYELSTTVTINKKDISGATLVLTPASTTYSAAEQSVSASVTMDNLAATVEVDDATSTAAATEIGTYSVTVNATGNFTGSLTGTWEIVNTTGSLSGVAATTSEDAGSYADGTLTIADTTALAYEDGAWTAGLTLTWPMESNSPALGNGYGRYVKPETMQMTIDGTVYTGREIVDSEAVYAKGKLEAEVRDGSYTYYQGLTRRTQNFSYLYSTTWAVTITPAAVEAALAEQKTSLEYTMRAGAFVWGDNTEGDPDGVEFADYTIELSLEDPIVFALGEGETHDLGNTLLTTTKIKLAPGASVTSTVQQPEGAIFVEATGYSIQCSASDGVYTYTTLFTHQHAWSFGVVDGTNLVATCANGDCDVGGEARMWLYVEATEKVYDGQSMVRAARYDDYFEQAFPDVYATVAVTKDGESVTTIKDAGVYAVVATISYLGNDETYKLSTQVTISPVDITGATLVLTPASTTYNGEEQQVEASVTVNNLAATIEVTEGTLSATEIGDYAVTVGGTGNFTGTTSGTWHIANTTGSLSGVAATTSAEAGSYADGTLTVTDTTALVYENGAWTAGLTLTWPMETKNWQALDWSSHAYYVTTNDVRITGDVGEIEHSTLEGSYTSGLNQTSRFNYLATTIWAVPITPAVVETALAEQKTALEYTIRAGAVQSGTYAQGVEFADYKIALPLDEPVTFVLGEGETYDLGATLLTTTKIKLAPGASVTTTAQQPEGAIFVEATGYSIQCSESDGVYTYTTLFTHQHAWSFEVVDGTNLVATCGNPECNLDGEVRMWLDVATTEKDYDGVAVVPQAGFGEGFVAQFPDMSTMLTVNGVEDGEILDAGEYRVCLAVTGLGDGATYLLSTDVTINRKDISEATLVLAPASTTYNAAEQTVTPSVTVGGLAATLEVAEGSVLAATEIGTYSVTVNGTDNFTGSASGEWTIANTTGSLKSVAATNAGVGTVANNTLTVKDTAALGYSNGAWSVGLVLEWPMTKQTILGVATGADYVTEDMVRISKECGEISHEQKQDSYVANWSNTPFTYLATTTWTVGLTPAAVEAALAEEKTVLEYTMRAGAIPSDTYAQGVAFADYKIALSLVDSVVFALGEGETHDLGATVLTTTRIRLAPDASVTSDAAQEANAIFTEDEEGYEVVVKEDEGRFVYTCVEKTVPSDIEDEEGNPAGYMEGETTAVVTNTVNAVTIPEGATMAEIVVSGNSAVLHGGEQLAIAIYATDENGVRLQGDDETVITDAFAVTYADGEWSVALDPEEATPQIDEADFTDIGEEEGVPQFTVTAVKGLWYGVGESDSIDGDFAIVGEVEQATGDTVTVSATATEASMKFYRVIVAPSKKALTE